MSNLDDQIMSSIDRMVKESDPDIKIKAEKQKPGNITKSILLIFQNKINRGNEIIMINTREVSILNNLINDYLINN